MGADLAAADPDPLDRRLLRAAQLRDPSRRVLERYIAMATAAGVPQAVYPEGGLSRDGLLRTPKLGILDYMLRSFDPLHGERDLVFIPVGINYDRVLEDRTRLLGQTPGQPSGQPRRGPLFAARTALRFVGRNLSLMLRSRWHRFGYACVNFGTPISMRATWRARPDLRHLSRSTRHPLLNCGRAMANSAA